MFDVAPTELLLVAMVALVVIGPKDLPKAMRFVGFWVGRARGVMRQFRSGFDSMVREAELQEMEKKWAAENERIMREHRPSTEHMLPSGASYGQDVVEHDTPAPDTADDLPVIVEQPAMVDQPRVAHAPDAGEAPAAVQDPGIIEPHPASTDPKHAS
jgi:sec-independent protein translocase protein TatB